MGSCLDLFDDDDTYRNQTRPQQSYYGQPVANGQRSEDFFQVRERQRKQEKEAHFRQYGFHRT